jgi:hypothetical protein
VYGFRYDPAFSIGSTCSPTHPAPGGKQNWTAEEDFTWPTGQVKVLIIQNLKMFVIFRGEQGIYFFG